VAKRADPRYLREVAYADPSGLEARASLYDYQRPWIDIIAEAIATLEPVEGCMVGDVGCGNGRYIAALRAARAQVIGVDLSVGMLDGVPGPRSGLVVADAESLPLADTSLDAVLMMHMLYHVPDPERAVKEVARVLRTNGRALVATNGSQHLGEMNALWLPLLERAGIRGDLQDVGLVNPRLTVGTAQQLVGMHLQDVEERWLRSAVVVTDAAPVIRHAASTTGAHLVGEQRDELLHELAGAVDAEIQRDGKLRITTEVVFLTARKP
jgi:SAM-dependent methyltransferase